MFRDNLYANRPDRTRAERKMANNPKPVLPMARLPFYRVRHTLLEEFIQDVFGFEFDFLMAVGQTEGVCVDYHVIGLDEANSEQFRRAENLRRCQRTKDVSLILNVLAEDKYIPKGKYTISTHPERDTTAAYTELLQATRNPLAPRCLAFKDQHKNDKVFISRAEMLDKLTIAQTRGQ